MRALTVEPLVSNNARLDDVAEPEDQPDTLLIEAVAVGICGTDREIIAGSYGAPPAGRQRLILGHESLGRVLDAPSNAPVRTGDLVVPMVRVPDPVPCANCAAGEWDMCSNGRYAEHGIKERDGFCVERFRLPPHRVVRVDPSLGTLAVLLEPASVVAKAWEHIERIGNRAVWNPRTALVTGAGPIGLLAAMMGVQRGLDVHVLDRVDSGPKVDTVRALGATYHASTVSDRRFDADVVLECTGAAPVISDVLTRNARNGIVCLTGVSARSRKLPLDLAKLNRLMVLENDVVFGSVNANRRHYEAAARSLLAADRNWLSRLITRTHPLDEWRDALVRRDADIKVVIAFS
jgi:threonine dehydrogenase-like Zn-dependent dehydrogenase